MKTIKVSDEIHAKLTAIGDKNESYNEVLVRLFSMINDLKRSLESASEKIQKSRELGRISLAHEGASELERGVEAFLKAVEPRSE